MLSNILKEILPKQLCLHIDVNPERTILRMFIFTFHDTIDTLFTVYSTGQRPTGHSTRLYKMARMLKLISVFVFVHMAVSSNE